MNAFGRRGASAFGQARGIAPPSPRVDFPPPGLSRSHQPLPNTPAPTAHLHRLPERLGPVSEGAGGSGPVPETLEVSAHRVKEQVLPHLLDRVDPEAAATLSVPLVVETGIGPNWAEAH